MICMWSIFFLVQCYSKVLYLKNIFLWLLYRESFNFEGSLKIASQRKTLSTLLIQGLSSAKKETIGIDILLTFRNGGRRIMQHSVINSSLSAACELGR